MKRPMLITIVAVVLGILWLLNTYSVAVSYGATSTGRFAWIAVTHLVAGVSIVGLWLMQFWGPALYLLGQAAGIAGWFMAPMPGAEDAIPPWAIFIVPILYAALVLPFWKRFAPFANASPKTEASA
jgi:hypothetical protein